MNDPSYIVIIQGLKQWCAFAFASNSLVAMSDQVSSSPMGTLKGLVTAFTTRLLTDYKNIVILTFHIGTLTASNLGGVLIPSATLTIVDENEDVNEMISK